MAKNNGAKWSGILLIGILLTAVPLLGGVDGDIKKSFSVREDWLLTIESDIGSIEVKSSSSSKVEVEIQFESRKGSLKKFKDILDDIYVDFDHSGKDVTVILDYPKSRSNFWNNVGRYVRVRFYITVPKKYNVDLSTSGGSIQVDDLTGEVRSRTSGGRWSSAWTHWSATTPSACWRCSDRSPGGG